MRKPVSRGGRRLKCEWEYVTFVNSYETMTGQGMHSRGKEILDNRVGT